MKARHRTIQVGHGTYRSRTNATLQRAVDAVARAGGGTVEIPAGVYAMNGALQLRDGVHLMGEPGAVLKKIPSVTSPLTHIVGYGHYEFRVADPDKFEVGMGVCIGDKNACGFYETVATIVGRKGDLFYIDRMCNHDYGPGSGGRVTSVFPLVSGFQVRDASVRELRLDGNPKERNPINGCRGGGVILLESHRVVIESVEVTNYHGDAISFQQCTDIVVRDCHVHHNRGGGIHPGSGSVRYVIAGNRIEHNAGCGVFYCLRTTHSICENNRITSNGRSGISVGERDTDHILRHNWITDNGEPGIDIREPYIQSGDRLWIEGNQIENNCGKQGAAEIAVARQVRDICVIGNAIRPSRVKAVSVGPDCRCISVVGNTISGREQRPADVTGNRAAVRFQKPAAFPRIGPAAARADDVRHLNQTRLPRWQTTHSALTAKTKWKKSS